MTPDASVSIVGPTSGEVLNLGLTQMRILEDGRTTNNRLGMAIVTVPPHAAGPIQHRHTQHDEGFYVISGTAQFTVGATTYDAPAGTWVLVPPGVPHTFGNPGDQPAILLSTFTPAFYIQYFRDMRNLVANGEQITPEVAAHLMSHYATAPATDHK